MSTKKCPYCGKENDVNNDICILCGKNISNENAKKIATKNNEKNEFLSFFIALVIVFLLFIAFFMFKSSNKEKTIISNNKSKPTIAERRAHLLSKEHLKNLTIDFGVIECWQKDSSKYIVIDHAGEIYAVNGMARSHAKKAGWKQAESLLKKGGDFTVFSDIIQVALKNGCTQYYGY